MSMRLSCAIPTFIASAIVIDSFSLPAYSNPNELTGYSDVKLVEADSNDGDSFTVAFPDGSGYHVRLYYVDCPESYCPTRASEQARVREQTGYFGLSGIEQTIAWGRKASGYTKQLLAKPFVVYTSHARAGSGRIYAFVTTSEGKDLARELLAKGLARNIGVRRLTPGGVSAEETEAQFADVEASAMLASAGIWSETKSDLLVQSRAAQREEEREFEEARARLETSENRGNRLEAKETRSRRLDINSASEEDLQSLEGIGPVIAARIVERRENAPFRSVDELASVKGIGRKLLERLRPHVVVNGEDD